MARAATMRVAWFLSCFVLGCTPTGERTLDLSATPKSARSGVPIRLKVLAVEVDGRVGAGAVTITTAAGSLREGITLELDGFGSAATDFVCNAAVDSLCKDKVRVVATWGEVSWVGQVLIEPGPPNVEVACENGVDDDEDGATDCLDPDCQDQLCDDNLKCTTNERCNNLRCGGGVAVVCDKPADPSCAEGVGTCDPAIGCVYRPRNTGLSCDDGNLCTSNDRCDSTGNCRGTQRSCDSPPSNNGCYPANGTCDRATGACEYRPRPDGTRCGTKPEFRCCSANCVSMVAEWANCGGCGLRCGSQVCVDAAVSASCGPAPLNTGLCYCRSDAECPADSRCLQNRCSRKRCQPRQALTSEDGTCPGFCDY